MRGMLEEMAEAQKQFEKEWERIQEKYMVPGPLVCSFCAKKIHVGECIAGTKVYMCYECVDASARSVADRRTSNRKEVGAAIAAKCKELAGLLQDAEDVGLRFDIHSEWDGTKRVVNVETKRVGL